MIDFFTREISIPLKKVVSILLIISFNLSSMYLYHNFLLEELLKQYFTNWETIFYGRSLFYVSLSASLIVGSLISNKINRRKLLFFWISIGIVCLLIMTFFSNLDNIFYLCAILGASYGFGIPSCFSALWDYTRVEERGRIAGLTQFSMFFLLLLLLVVPSLFSFSLREYQILSILLRVASLAALIEPFNRLSGSDISIFRILRTKDFLLFTVPWLMFNLSNGVLLILENIVKRDPNMKTVLDTSSIFLFLGTVVFGIIAGIIADRSGRKQPLIFGFIILGISYTLVGISSSPQAWFTMVALSGIGWGFIMITYQWVILGDIAPVGSREKYFALGFVISTLVETVFMYVSSIVVLEVGANYISAAISLCLFLSVFPLLLAKETMPEDKIRDRRLRDYLRKVAGLIEESR